MSQYTATNANPLQIITPGAGYTSLYFYNNKAWLRLNTGEDVLLLGQPYTPLINFFGNEIVRNNYFFQMSQVKRLVQLIFNKYSTINNAPVSYTSHNMEIFVNGISIDTITIDNIVGEQIFNYNPGIDLNTGDLILIKNTQKFNYPSTSTDQFLRAHLSGTRNFITGYYAIWYSDDDGELWNPVYINDSAHNIGRLDSNILWIINNNLKISPDNGLSWNTAVSSTNVPILTGNKLFTLNNSGVIYKSLDYGVMWEIDTTFSTGRFLYAGSGADYVIDSSSIWRSLDSGTSWSVIGTGSFTTSTTSIDFYGQVGAIIDNDKRFFTVDNFSTISTVNVSPAAAGRPSGLFNPTDGYYFSSVESANTYLWYSGTGNSYSVTWAGTGINYILTNSIKLDSITYAHYFEYGGLVIGNYPMLLTGSPTTVWTNHGGDYYQLLTSIIFRNNASSCEYTTDWNTWNSTDLTLNSDFLAYATTSGYLILDENMLYYSSNVTNWTLIYSGIQLVYIDSNSNIFIKKLSNNSLYSWYRSTDGGATFNLSITGEYTGIFENTTYIILYTKDILLAKVARSVDGINWIIDTSDDVLMTMQMRFS